MRCQNFIYRVLSKMNLSEGRVGFIFGQHGLAQRHQLRGRSDKEQLVADIIELTDLLFCVANPLLSDLKRPCVRHQGSSGLDQRCQVKGRLSFAKFVIGKRVL